MPNRMVRMERIRKIIDLYVNANLSERGISRAVNLSRPVISKYIMLFKKTGLSNDDLKKMSDSELNEKLGLGKKGDDNPERLKTLTGI